LVYVYCELILEYAGLILSCNRQLKVVRSTNSHSDTLIDTLTNNIPVLCWVVGTLSL